MTDSTEEVLYGNYTADEQKLLDTRKKSLGDRPSYYDSNGTTYIEITDTFENFLILASNEFKENALNWINDTTKKDDDFSLRDELLTKTITNEFNYIEALFGELSGKIRKYREFRSTMKGLKDSNALEVGFMLSSLQQGMEEILYYFDKYELSLKIITSIRRKSEQIINPENLKERQSWANPILEYT